MDGLETSASMEEQTGAKECSCLSSPRPFHSVVAVEHLPHQAAAVAVAAAAAHTFGRVQEMETAAMHHCETSLLPFRYLEMACEQVDSIVTSRLIAASTSRLVTTTRCQEDSQ